MKENYRPSASTLLLPPTQHQFGADNRLAGRKLKAENFGISALSSIMSEAVLYCMCVESVKRHMATQLTYREQKENNEILCLFVVGVQT